MLNSTLWQFNIAIEHDHWNSGFSHSKWWFSTAMLVITDQRVCTMIIFEFKTSCIFWRNRAAVHATWELHALHALIEILAKRQALPRMGWEVSLVGGWATSLKNMKVNWDDYSQYMGKNVPNHQPGFVTLLELAPSLLMLTPSHSPSNCWLNLNEHVSNAWLAGVEKQVPGASRG